MPAVLLAAAAALSSCGLAALFSDGSGEISLLIEGSGVKAMSAAGSETARTIAPSLNMTPASYVVTGSGPGGSRFSMTTTSTSVTKGGLKNGTWTITVSARNSAATSIASGSGSVSVSGSAAASLAVSLSPLAGNGTISVTVTWNAAAVPGGTVTGQLLPPSGPAIPLTFAAGTGSSTANAGGIPEGYYTLVLQLVSGSSVVMGAVDVARILQGQLTAGSYDFTQAAATGGTTWPISVSITPADTSPLSVSLNGQVSALNLGSSMTVTASVAGYSGNVTYVWYLNGQGVGTGSTTSPSLALGGSLQPGTYRLDAAAFSADGLRAGAATCAFTIN